MYFDEQENDPRRMLATFDVTTVGPDDQPPGRLILSRIGTLLPAQTRGRIHPWTPHAVLCQVAFVDAARRYSAGETIYGYVGGCWRVVDRRAHAPAQGVPEVTDIDRPDGRRGEMGLVSYHHQIAVYRPLFWHVAFGYRQGGASVLIPCDARAILDLFRYRDLPPGGRRRDALLHWVSEHWRRTASDPDDARRVHEHLRGQTDFVWREGLWVRVMPSADDKKRVEAGHKHEGTPSAPP